jgi:CheY-like chemotaxis protein/Tfp pilus assembly protein PilZ
MDKKAILLVDDVELFLELEKSFLARESFSLHTARNGREALEKARSLRPDVILLDLYMPDLDGDVVCRTLKSSAPTSSIPVIMISSDSGHATRDRCFAAGCDGFVAKPLQREPLLAIIEEMLKVAQRRSPRVSTHLECVIRMTSGERRSWIHCLSEGGVFVETVDSSFSPGEEIGLTFALAHGGKAIQVRGTVRWAGMLSGRRTVQGVGVEFLMPDPATREGIRDFIASKRGILHSLTRFS